MGIVIMHGKAGSPSKHVADLAKALKKAGYLVANIEMPWSGKRNYDVSTEAAEMEIEKALASLRADGAQKVFVSGHSQGGGFALHFGGKHQVDGIICIAPGGNISDRSPVYNKFLAPSIEKAKQLVAEGKGDKKTTLKDYEASRNTYSIKTVPSAYLTWFDPNGAMSMFRAAKQMNSQVPVLWMVAEKDYPQLITLNAQIYPNIPSNPLSRTYTPKSDHLGAPEASIEEIIRWTTEVATAGN
jgi:esterase/lipase